MSPRWCWPRRASRPGGRVRNRATTSPLRVGAQRQARPRRERLCINPQIQGTWQAMCMSERHRTPITSLVKPRRPHMKWQGIFDAMAVALIGSSFSLIAWTLLSHVWILGGPAPPIGIASLGSWWTRACTSPTLGLMPGCVITGDAGRASWPAEREIPKRANSNRLF